MLRSPLFLVAILTLAATGPATPQQGILASAELEISVHDQRASVVARYTLIDAAPAVRLSLLRIAGQVIRLDPSVQGARLLSWDTLPGLWRLEISPDASDTAGVELQYQVEGALTRIPVLVPASPTAPPGSSVRISVTGIPPERGKRAGFPRLRASEDGILLASPDHLPAFVQLAARAAPIPLLAEWLVVVVVIAGTAAWLLWFRNIAVRRQRGR